MKPTDVRVDAIRNDIAVGKTTCSVISECFDDDGITSELDNESIVDQSKAILWARGQQLRHLERGLNQRFGDDDDWQLKTYNEFVKLCAENPIKENQ